MWASELSDSELRRAHIVCLSFDDQSEPMVSWYVGDGEVYCVTRDKQIHVFRSEEAQQTEIVTGDVEMSLTVESIEWSWHGTVSTIRMATAERDIQASLEHL